MTIGPLPDRDHDVVDALAADRYLDDILAAAERRADDAPTDASLDPALRHATRVLRRALVRVHPSFRFEERLSARLAELAARASAEPAMAGAVVAFAEPHPGRATSADLDATDPLLRTILAGELDPANDAVLEADSRLAAARRPLLVGGAITSAAISLVGVAWVAWRATRPATRASAASVVAGSLSATRSLPGAGSLPGTGSGGPA